jgi:hypothetical protein
MDLLMRKSLAKSRRVHEDDDSAGDGDPDAAHRSQNACETVANA